ncbi:MAG: hypothetical protein NVS3B1_23560 [Marmoricola sp.]
MVGISMDARQVSRVARGIRAASPVAWKAARVELLAVGEEVAQGVRAASSWSTRIPGSVKVSVTAAGNVRVSVGGDAAPDAVPIENKGKGFVRHPVFGKRETWTARGSKPAFLLPTFAAKKEASLEKIEQVYLDAFVAAFERG